MYRVSSSTAHIDPDLATTRGGKVSRSRGGVLSDAKVLWQGSKRRGLRLQRFELRRRHRVAESSWKLGQKDRAEPATLLLKVGPFSQMVWTRSRAEGCTSCTVADRWAATSTRLASMKLENGYETAEDMTTNGAPVAVTSLYAYTKNVVHATSFRRLGCCSVLYFVCLTCKFGGGYLLQSARNPAT